MLFKLSFDFCGIIEVKNNRRSCEIFHTRSRKIPRFCLFFLVGLSCLKIAMLLLFPNGKFFKSISQLNH